MSNWIDRKLILHDYDEEVEVSFDGINSHGYGIFASECTCMMAGIAGGYGYFTDEFATIEDKLILSDVTHWRHINK